VSRPNFALLFGLRALATALSVGAPAAAQVSLGDPFNPMIGGVPVHCVSAGTGQPVAFVANPYLNDVGRAQPGFPPTIELNPVLLMQLPPKLQLFWYGHECGHHVLGHTIGAYSQASESEADCWAIERGRSQRLFRRRDVAGFEPYFRNNAGSPWGHLPGPLRAAHLMSCYDGSSSGGSGNDSCTFARDGTCDEPDVCDRGTDSSDCRGRTDMGAERSQELPSYCCTPVGRLGPYPNPGPDGIAVNAGQLCHGTHPMYGPVGGQACH
jgi:hypothetical protein